MRHAVLLLVLALLWLPFSAQRSSAQQIDLGPPAWCMNLPAARQPAISIDFEHASISTVSNFFADFLKTNIVLTRGVQGTVTARLHDVNICEAFDAILRLKGLYVISEGSVHIVYSLDSRPLE